MACNGLNSRNLEAGLTLLEVVVAVGILTVGILAVATMQISAIRGNASAGKVTEATAWAADQLEKLMNLPYGHGDLQDTDGDGSGGLEDATEATDDNPNPSPKVGDYSIYWNVAVDEAISASKTLNVIVTWDDHGVQKRVSIRSVISST
jgi:type IV pilus assembly protein PilV